MWRVSVPSVVSVLCVSRVGLRLVFFLTSSPGGESLSGESSVSAVFLTAL